MPILSFNDKIMLINCVHQWNDVWSYQCYAGKPTWRDTLKFNFPDGTQTRLMYGGHLDSSSTFRVDGDEFPDLMKLYQVEKFEAGEWMIGNALHNTLTIPDFDWYGYLEDGSLLNICVNDKVLSIEHNMGEAWIVSEGSYWFGACKMVGIYGVADQHSMYLLTQYRDEVPKLFNAYSLEDDIVTIFTMDFTKETVDELVDQFEELLGEY